MAATNVPANQQYQQQNYANAPLEFVKPISQRPLTVSAQAKRPQTQRFKPASMQVDLEWLRRALAEFYRIYNPDKLKGLEDVLREFVKRGATVEELDLLNEDLRHR